MWVGTASGLYSYDGYRTTAHFKKNTFSNDRIYAIVTDDNDLMYLGSDSGLMVFNCRTDRYEPMSKSSPRDVRILIRKGGTIWLGTHTGLYSYDIKTGKFSRHRQMMQLINTMTDTPEGLMIGTGKGVWFYKSGRIKRIESPLLNGHTVRSSAFDRRRKCVWIGLNRSLCTYNFKNHNVNKEKDIHGFQNKKMALDLNGNLLIATDNGMYSYSPNRGVIHLMHDAGRGYSLINNVVWTLFTDRWQNIWIGTDDGFSIWKASNHSISFISVEELVSGRNGNRFDALLEDNLGNIWAGGTDGLIKFAMESDGYNNVAWFRPGDMRHPFPHSRIHNIYRDQQSGLWVASDGGVSFYDYNRGQFRTFIVKDKQGHYTSEWAYDILEDRRGRMWIAAYMGGIFIIDRSKLLASGGLCVADKHLDKEYSHLSDLHVNHLAQDKNGNIWALQSNNHIDFINSRTLKVTTLKSSAGHKFLNLITDGRGEVWACHKQGVLHYHSEKEAPEDIKLADGSQTASIDNFCNVDGTIWAFSEGDCWILGDRVKNMNLNPQITAVAGAVYARKEKKVLLGVRDGIWAVSTDIMQHYDNGNYSIQLSELDVNGKPYVTEDEESVRSLKVIRLPYDENNLTFHFTDFPYKNLPVRPYVYKLEGVSSAWQYMSADSKDITFNGLPHGSYTLKICTANPDGTPAQEVYSMQIRISPPWYLSVWAKLFYFAVIVMLVLWIIKFYVMRNRLRMEKLAKERILEQSKAKIYFYTHLSHDLKTPLSLISGPVSHLLSKANDVETRRELEYVQRNAALLGSLIHRALDVNKLDNLQENTLTLTHTDIVELCRRLLNNFRPTALEKDIKLVFNTNVEVIYTDIDQIKWESVLNNLISNAMKYTLTDGTVTLSMEKDEDGKNVRIALADTGMGIAREDLPYIFQRYYQAKRTAGRIEGSGIGLYVVKKYTELSGGTVSVESEVNRGSVFTLSFPLSETKESTTPTDEKKLKKYAPTVLVVEDNSDMLGFIVQLLSTEYRVLTAANGQEGYELFMKESPELVLTDIMMPVMDGIEMCRKIRGESRGEETLIIMLTAKTDIATQLESMKSDVDLFVTKPFEPQLLLMQIARLFAQKQKTMQKARKEFLTKPVKDGKTESYDELLLGKITRVIEENIENQDFNVNALCTEIGVNDKQVYRKLKQFTGMTTVEYIRNIRMKRAAMYLEQGKFTVAEVMYMVGFSNHSYFSRCFQGFYGMTPKEYMNRKG